MSADEQVQFIIAGRQNQQENQQDKKKAAPGPSR
jgi:hypothetical protein